jgi:hypothetical protein
MLVVRAGTCRPGMQQHATHRRPYCYGLVTHSNCENAMTQRCRAFCRLGGHQDGSCCDLAALLALVTHQPGIGQVAHNAIANKTLNYRYYRTGLPLVVIYQYNRQNRIPSSSRYAGGRFLQAVSSAIARESLNSRK